MMTKEQAQSLAAEDIALVKRVQQGDKQAFNILVLRYQHKVCDIAYKFVSNPVDANDIAQEAFIRAYKSIDSFRGESSFYTWMFRVTSNVAKTYLEVNNKHRYAVDVDDPEFNSKHDVHGMLVSNEGPDALFDSHELSNIINEALNELPEDLKRALLLREVKGLSYDEISEIMESPLGTVRSRIFRARQHIEEKLARFERGLQFGAVYAKPVIRN